MVLIVIGLVVLAAVFIYGLIKLINAVFNPAIRALQEKKRRITKTDNPYIQAHRQRINNDQNYQEYLQWLDNNDGHLPIDKVKTDEEMNFENELIN